MKFIVETEINANVLVALRGRAWIEINFIMLSPLFHCPSPSAGGRGLKYITEDLLNLSWGRPPREGVD